MGFREEGEVNHNPQCGMESCEDLEGHSLHGNGFKK